MDWIKQNKFLSGWIAVTLIGAAALGYLMFTAKGAYATAQADYEAKVGELQSLQGKTPYPDEENVKKMQELQKAHQSAIDQLHKDLAKTELPLVPLSAVRFQDELRESVRRVTTSAAAGKLQLPQAAEKFYMDFDRYQAEPPKDEAAAPLGRMLKAMEEVMKLLIASGATQLIELKRDPLPEEGIERTGTSTAAATPKPAKDAGPELVKRQSFVISFIASEASLRSFLNNLVKSKEQFFIPRSIVLENEKPTGPPKVAAPGPGVPVPPPAPGIPGAAAGDGIQFIVGEEKLKVTMRIDVVDFADPAPATAKTAK